jgi:hypothetical protein
VVGRAAGAEPGRADEGPSCTLIFLDPPNLTPWDLDVRGGLAARFLTSREGCCGLDRPSLALQSPLCRPGAMRLF